MIPCNDNKLTLVSCAYCKSCLKGMAKPRTPYLKHLMEKCSIYEIVTQLLILQAIIDSSKRFDPEVASRVAIKHTFPIDYVMFMTDVKDVYLGVAVFKGEHCFSSVQSCHALRHAAQAFQEVVAVATIAVFHDNVQIAGIGEAVIKADHEGIVCHR